jgi:hypothetical protein
LWLSNANAKGARSVGGCRHAPPETFEFLYSLERYFTYFRTRFEEKLQPQKAIFKSPNVVESKKYFCKTLYTQIQQQNSTVSSFLKCKLYCRHKKNEAHLAAIFELFKCSNVLSTTIRNITTFIGKQKSWVSLFTHCTLPPNFCPDFSFSQGQSFWPLGGRAPPLPPLATPQVFLCMERPMHTALCSIFLIIREL